MGFYPSQVDRPQCELVDRDFGNATGYAMNGVQIVTKGTALYKFQSSLTTSTYVLSVSIVSQNKISQVLFLHWNVDMEKGLEDEVDKQ